MPPPHSKRPRNTTEPFLEGFTNEDVHNPSDLFNSTTLHTTLDLNLIEYKIYPDPLHHTSMVDLAALIMSFVGRWTAGHLWHKEPFLLVPVGRAPEIDEPFLMGRTKFGDCIDDEWFIVFLLKEITKEFPHLIVSVQDNDGDFLLIEAAHHIPPTLDPTNSPNRVFIHRSAIHIIPLPAPPPLPTTTNLHLRDAIKAVRSFPNLTIANDAVQKCIIERTDVFPARNRDMRHRVLGWVPRDVARVLQRDPGLVAAAVEAFYLRDPVRMKQSITALRFDDLSNHDPFSTFHQCPRPILLTRTLYAQLAANTTVLPSTSSSSSFDPLSVDLESKDFRRFDVGMRIACGFEMLVDGVKGEKVGKEGETLETYPFESDPEWRAYKERLNKLGYYKSELSGSQLYRSLDHIAREQYFATQKRSGDDDEGFLNRNPVARVFEVLRNAPDQEVFLEGEGVEDSDQWMEVTVAELEERMGKVMGEGRGGGLGGLAGLEEVGVEEEGVRRVGNVVEGVKGFMGKSSGVGGALVPGEVDSDDDDMFGDDGFEDDSDDSDAEFEEEFLRNKNGRGDAMDEDEDRPVFLDSDKFMKAVMKALGVDESIMKPINRSNLPTPPSEAAPASTSSAVIEQAARRLLSDDEDEESQDEDGVEEMEALRIKRALRKQRTGVQEVEWDSDEEKEIVRKFDEGVLGEAEREEGGVKVVKGGKKRVVVGRGFGEDGSDSDDESDVEMGIEEYMAAMDLELRTSKIGRELVDGLEVGATSTVESGWGIGSSTPNKGFLMDEDERVIARPTRVKGWEGEVDDNDEEDGMVEVEEEEGRMVRLDAEMVANLVESFRSQHGMAGPASNLLGRLGVVLPHVDD
ncbi:SGT1 protein-domain-containing protein [Chytridium lagenaria]|nr:SGT1 protein-domain-containing protein [Chytridium lagenaria]